MRNQSVEKEAEPPDFERLQVQFKATGEPSGIRTPDTLIRSQGIIVPYLMRIKEAIRHINLRRFKTPL